MRNPEQDDNRTLQGMSNAVKSSGGCVLVWFRLDLRLHDHPALHAGLERAADAGVVPCFIWSPEEDGQSRLGGASRWWLYHSLARLDESLRQVGSKLIIRVGSAVNMLPELVRETGAIAVYWSRRYEPAVIVRDAAVKKRLTGDGIEAESFNAALLHEPWTIRTAEGKPYRVYTPFWRACLASGSPAEPTSVPNSVPRPTRWPRSDRLDDLGLLPTLKWADEFAAHFTPGEAGAVERLRRFVLESAEGYALSRDLPGVNGTSGLSPHLHFGEVSPRRIWHEIMNETTAGNALRSPDDQRAGPVVFLKEIVWREFAYHLLFHFPHTTRDPLRADFSRFPWRVDQKGFRTWSRGLTGYPIVDAGMRQLWRTGWMHNRVRMIAASFLVKDLLLPWQDGARWFHDTLLDADLASNTLGWQWTAGCGADAAPYFRIFNPVLQGEKYDPEGTYVRKHVPELARLGANFIHQPWRAPAEALAAAGVRLGETYPERVVDHHAARDRALAALAQVTRS